MNWNDEYRISRSLTLEIAPSGELLARNSQSRSPMSVEFDALPVLSAFARRRTPRAALDALRRDWDLDEQGFATVVEGFIDRNVLIGAQVERAEERGLARGGFAGLRAHHNMLRDTRRALAYRTPIRAHCRDQHVVEIGCGTGILSVFAAQAGARRVTAIEETRIASIAREVFAANGVGERVDLCLGNSHDVEIEEPADVIVHEVIGMDPFAENMLSSIDDARRRFLRPGGRLIPYRVEVCCVALDVGEDVEHKKASALSKASAYAETYGVDLEPFQSALAALNPLMFRDLAPPGADDELAARIRSREAVLFDVDFREDTSRLIGASRNVSLACESPGDIGDVLVYFRAHLDDNHQLDNAPNSERSHWGRMVVPLRRLVRVRAGDTLAIEAHIVQRAGIHKLKIELA